MMREIWPFILIFLISVLVSSISQIVLKTSANKEYDNLIREYLNVRVILAYGLFFSSTLLTTYAYRGVPLSLGPVIECTGYVYVAVLGALILKEKFSKKKVIGNLLIILGILVYALW